MTITYDHIADAIYIQFRVAEIVETDELQPLMIADYDAEGNIIGIEILQASQRIDKPNEMLFKLISAVPQTT